MTTLYLSKISETAIKPHKHSTYAACYDIHVDLKGEEVVVIPPRKTYVFGTGYKMVCNQGYRICVYARSSLAVSKGCMLANGVGMIDSDYRGEVMLPIYNATDEPVTIQAGERVAQLAIEEVVPVMIDDSGYLPPSNSNRKGGLGSTGTH